MSADVLWRQVHTLALSYHWPEDAILGLPRARRQRYLALLAEAADARGRGGAP